MLLSCCSFFFVLALVLKSVGRLRNQTVMSLCSGIQTATHVEGLQRITYTCTVTREGFRRDRPF